jgi:hypothetical protein
MMLGIFFVLAYLVPPTLLVWGWTRWVRSPKLRSIGSVLSLIGFSLATASALLAVLTVGYAQIHHFPYYDPLLLRIIRWGVLLSFCGIVFGIDGVWRPNPLRWHAALISGLAMLAFWIMVAEGE